MKAKLLRKLRSGLFIVRANKDPKYPYYVYFGGMDRQFVSNNSSFMYALVEVHRLMRERCPKLLKRIKRRHQAQQQKENLEFYQSRIYP